MVTRVSILTLILLKALQGSLAYSKTAPAAIEAALREAALQADVPFSLLKAICRAESNLNPLDYEHNDGGPSNHAFGMCQVLYETGSRIVGRDKGCKRDFRKGSGLARTPANCKLFGLRANTRAAARYLRDQLKRYDDDTVKATAAYNAGSVRVCGPSGVVRNNAKKVISSCVPGGLLNQFYVGRVDYFMDSAHIKEVGPDAAQPQFIASASGSLL